MAEQLGVSEETVRRDLSYADVEGRPGAGYELTLLLDALEKFLDLTEHHPFVTVANNEMLASLAVMFPAEMFGLRAVAYFSDRDEDSGARVDGLDVHHLSELPTLGPELGATIALVACEPDAVQRSLSALKDAGITGVLMLTPVLKPEHPKGMNVNYFRIPCALKSLVGSELPSCCH
jgi:redox-sensing transcriptional repressor